MSNERELNLMATNATLRTEIEELRSLCLRHAGMVGELRQRVRDAESDLARVRGDLERAGEGATLHRVPVGVDATLLMETKAGCQPSVFIGGYWCSLSDLLTAINSLEVEA